MRAIVTGGAAGIGRAVAGELARRGWDVVLVDRDPAVVEVAAGIGATARVADVTAPVEDPGPVDLVACCAGVSVAGPFGALPVDAALRLMDVNFGGTARWVHACLPGLRASRGHVITVASSFAWLGFPEKAAYSASKAAIRAFSESLAAELAPDGISVTTVFPGPVRTGLVRTGTAADEAQRAREDAFLHRRGLEPAYVARRMVDAAVGRRRLLVLSLDYRVFGLAVRVAPRLAWWLAARFGRL